MIQFIEEVTKSDGTVIGVPYCLTPKAYASNSVSCTLYFDDVQSTDLFYHKRIFFLSDNETVNISIPENDIFFIFDTSKLYDETDPSKLANIESLDQLRINILSSTGTAVNNRFLHCLNIGCSSPSAGGFSESLYIDDNEYVISADFHTQHEEYEILLHNQGINLPRDIQRSFYKTNIHEHFTDWVTLNRKYKELLLNIVNILYKKGSYKSLIDSLKWFEYGDMVKMHEYWSTPELKTLHEKEVNLLYTDMLQDMMKMYMKSTFISLSFTMQDIDTDENGVKYEVDTYNNEEPEKTFPVLKDRQILWGRDDIALKMTLLGNYFSTYFMPIHLDLLFSSIEDTVFATPFKVGHTYSDIIIDSITPRDYTIRLNQEIDSKYYSGDVYVTGDKNIDNFNRCCIVPASTEPQDDNDPTTAYEQLYVGVGALVNIDFNVSSLRYPESIFNKISIRVIDVNNKSQYANAESSLDNLKVNDDYAMTLFIKDCGKYAVYISVNDEYGNIVSLKRDIEVAPGKCLFNIYKLDRVEDYNYINRHAFDTYVAITGGDNNYNLPQYMTLWSESNKSKFYYPESVLSNVSACIFKKADGFYMCTDWEKVKTPALKKEIEYTHYTIDSFKQAFDKGDISDKYTSFYLNGWTYAYRDIDDVYGVIALISYLSSPIITYTVRPFPNDTDEHKVINTRPSHNSGFYRSFMKDENGVIISRGADVLENVDEDRICWFYNDKRFVPSIWGISKEIHFNNVKEKDAVFLCAPIVSRFAKEYTPTWTITNESIKDSGEIIDVIYPIFWCNNKRGNRHKGIYSITLKQIFNNNTYSQWTYKNAFRVV